MKKTKLAVIIGLSVCMLVSGCARHGSVATGSTTPSQTAGTPMTTYNREWIEKNVLTSDNKDEIDAWYFYADYIKDTPEFKAGAHKASEYWDADGNFVNPAKTAMDADWVCIPTGVGRDEVIDAAIPQEVMDKMTTKQLLETASEEKAIIAHTGKEMYYLPNYLSALGKSTAYREFLSRDDFASVLYDYYMSINPSEYIGDDFRESDSDTILHSKSYVRSCSIFFNEVTMATDDFYDNLTEDERANVVKKSVEISDYIKKHDVTKSLFGVAWSAYSESGYSAFDSTVRKYDISPKWKAYMGIDDSELKNDVSWDTGIIAGFGDVFYPDYEVTSKEIDGKTYPVLTADDWCIVGKRANGDDESPIESLDIYKNDELITTLKLEGTFGDNVDENRIYNNSRNARALYRDVTGDGVKDIIIKSDNYGDYSSYDNQILNSCYIIDGKSAKTTEINMADYFKYFKDNLDIEYDKNEPNIKLKVTPKEGESAEHVVGTSEALEDVLTGIYPYVYVEDNDIRVGFWIDYICKDPNVENGINHGYVDMVVYKKLQFNAENGQFELTGEFQYDMGIKPFSYSEVDETVYNGAMEAYSKVVWTE